MAELSPWAELAVRLGLVFTGPMLWGALVGVSCLRGKWRA